MPKKQLKKLGVSERLLKDILTITVNNPDQLCMIDGYKPPTSISIPALNISKFPDDYYDLFIKNEIYNIIYMNLEIGRHTFVCKYTSGNIVNYSLSKKEYKSKLDAFAVALLYFIKNVNKNNIQH
jgi:hypothetical protein